MDKLHYHLGKLFGKRYRLWYWKRHGNAWLWGMTAAIKETPVTEVYDAPLSKKDFEDYIKSIV
jgi:hypothetical protein